MARNRKWTDEQLARAAKENVSCSGTTRSLGLVANSGNCTGIKQHIKRLGIDISHWTGQGHLKGKSHNWGKKRQLSEIMTVNSTFSRGHLKKRLLKDGILKNECCLCGQGPTWNNKPLVMRLDHINGVNNDHRLENLRIVCPNCDTQQDTFCGRNIEKKTRKPHVCVSCGKNISDSSKSGKCRKCVEPRRSPRGRKQYICVICGENISSSSKSSKCRSCYVKSTRKVEWPSKEILEKLIWEIPTLKISKQFGVSDRTIADWCENYGISKPPRGYWAKQASVPQPEDGAILKVV